MALNCTITPANGKIWSHNLKPKEDVQGLICVLGLPASKVASNVRAQSFTAVAYNDSEHLAGVDTMGNVYSFNLKSNRACKLATAGCPGTCCCFSPGAGRLTLFVGFEDCSIRAYDITKSVSLGILREHRNPPTHLVYRARTGELLSTSIDAVILWDAKRLCRKRALGSGPTGPLQATFTADEEQIVTMFKDGSFYVWQASGFTLVRSFLVSGAIQMRRMQHAFAVSPDGELLVSAGLHLGLLLVYSLISGALLHAVRLPDTDSICGATQLRFLPCSTTVTAMCSDGGVRCFDVLKGALTLEVPNIFPDRKDKCSFTMNERSDSLAVVSDGKILLYNLATARKNAPPPRPLELIPRENVESAYKQVPLQLSGVKADDTDDRDTRSKGRYPTPHGRNAAGKALAQTGTSGPGKDAPLSRQTVLDMGKLSHRELSLPSGALGSYALARNDKASPESPEFLNRKRLMTLLDQFGEYPAKYRLLIWGFLMELPHNQMAFQALVNRGLHESYSHLVAKSPLQNRALVTRLAQALSQLAHWCPVFASVGFMPSLVFPFVKLHAAGATSGSNESCFEMLATLLINWTQGWFECFPDPPLGILSRLDALLGFHDNDLAVHVRRTCRGGVPTVSWSLLQDLMTGVLALSDWLKLWDHCFTAGPDYLYYFLVSYLMAIKPTLTALDSENKIATFLGKPPTVDINKTIRAAYQLRMTTPDALRPTTAEWAPLPKTGTYTEFTQYPVAGVELFAQERKKVMEAEEALARRRRVVADLAIKSKAAALQANSLALERKQLGELQHERREQLRQLELAMLEETRRLEDKAKEEKLKQIATIEASYQDAAESVRQEWQRELIFLRQDINERRRMVASQLQSKEEAEQVNILEFKAWQRLTALEAETAQAAMLAKMRDEAHVRTAEIEARQRNKMREWEAEEEARRLKLQHEDAHRYQMKIAAEDAAAQAAVRKELVAAQLAAEDQTTKLDAERRLRALAEEQGRITVRALETERQRMATRAAADEQALMLQAAADAAWYEAETARRNALLAAERDSLHAAEQQAVQKLEETEAKIKLYGGQAALLERRRAMETITVDEKAQALRLVDAIAVERARAAILTQELSGREEELAAALAAARHTSATEHASVGAMIDLEAARATLASAQQKDLDSLRRAHRSRMEFIYKDHKGTQQDSGPGPGGAGDGTGGNQSTGNDAARAGAQTWSGGQGASAPGPPPQPAAPAPGAIAQPSSLAGAAAAAAATAAHGSHGRAVLAPHTTSFAHLPAAPAVHAHPSAAQSKGARRMWDASDPQQGGSDAGPSRTRRASDGSIVSAGGTAWAVPAGAGSQPLGALPDEWAAARAAGGLQGGLPDFLNGGEWAARFRDAPAGSLTAEEWAAARAAAGLGVAPGSPSLGAPSRLEHHRHHHALSLDQQPRQLQHLQHQDQQEHRLRALGLPLSSWQLQQQQQQERRSALGEGLPQRRVAELEMLREQVAALQVKRTHLQQVLMGGGSSQAASHHPQLHAPFDLTTPKPAPSTPSSSSYTCTYDTPSSTIANTTTTSTSASNSPAVVRGGVGHKQPNAMAVLMRGSQRDTSAPSPAASSSIHPGRARGAHTASGSSHTGLSGTHTGSTHTFTNDGPSTSSASNTVSSKHTTSSSAPTTATHIHTAANTAALLAGSDSTHTHTNAHTSSTAATVTTSSSEQYATHKAAVFMLQQSQSRPCPPMPYTPTASSTPASASISGLAHMLTPQIPHTSATTNSTPASGSISDAAHLHAPLYSPTSQQSHTPPLSQYQPYVTTSTQPQQLSRQDHQPFGSILTQPQHAASSMRSDHRQAYLQRLLGASGGTYEKEGHKRVGGSLSSMSSGTSSMREGVHSWSGSSSDESGGEGCETAAGRPAHPTMPCLAGAAGLGGGGDMVPGAPGGASKQRRELGGTWWLQGSPVGTQYEPGAAAEEALSEDVPSSLTADTISGQTAGQPSSLYDGARQAGGGGAYSVGRSQEPGAAAEEALKDLIEQQQQLLTPPPRPSTSHTTSSSPLLSASGLSATESGHGYGRQGAQATVTRSTPRTTASSSQNMPSNAGSGNKAAPPLGSAAHSNVANSSCTSGNSGASTGNNHNSHSSSATRSRGAGSISGVDIEGALSHGKGHGGASNSRSHASWAAPSSGSAWQADSHAPAHALSTAHPTAHTPATPPAARAQGTSTHHLAELPPTQAVGIEPLQHPSPALTVPGAPFLAPHVPGSDILSALTASSGPHSSSLSALSGTTRSAATAAAPSVPCGATKTSARAEEDRPSYGDVSRGSSHASYGGGPDSNHGSQAHGHSTAGSGIQRSAAFSGSTSGGAYEGRRDGEDSSSPHSGIGGSKGRSENSSGVEVDGSKGYSENDSGGEVRGSKGHSENSSGVQSGAEHSYSAASGFNALSRTGDGEGQVGVDMRGPSGTAQGLMDVERMGPLRGFRDYRLPSSHTGEAEDLGGVGGSYLHRQAARDSQYGIHRLAVQGGRFERQRASQADSEHSQARSRDLKGSKHSVAESHSTSYHSQTLDQSRASSTRCAGRHSTSSNSQAHSLSQAGGAHSHSSTSTHSHGMVSTHSHGMVSTHSHRSTSTHSRGVDSSLSLGGRGITAAATALQPTPRLQQPPHELPRQHAQQQRRSSPPRQPLQWSPPSPVPAPQHLLQADQQAQQVLDWAPPPQQPLQPFQLSQLSQLSPSPSPQQLQQQQQQQWQLNTPEGARGGTQRSSTVMSEDVDVEGVLARLRQDLAMTETDDMSSTRSATTPNRPKASPELGGLPQMQSPLRTKNGSGSSSSSYGGHAEGSGASPTPDLAAAYYQRDSLSPSPLPYDYGGPPAAVGSWDGVAGAAAYRYSQAMQSPDNHQG